MIKFSTGKLLITKQTSKWSKQQRDEGQREEERRIFFNFSARDEGRSRGYVTACDDKDIAKTIADCLEAIIYLDSVDDKKQAIPKLMTTAKWLKQRLNI